MTMTKSIKKKAIPRLRRIRYFGLNDSILRNKTVFLLPCMKNSSDFNIGEATIYDTLKQDDEP